MGHTMHDEFDTQYHGGSNTHHEGDTPQLRVIQRIMCATHYNIKSKRSDDSHSSTNLNKKQQQQNVSVMSLKYTRATQRILCLIFIQGCLLKS